MFLFIILLRPYFFDGVAVVVLECSPCVLIARLFWCVLKNEATHMPSVPDNTASFILSAAQASQLIAINTGF